MKIKMYSSLYIHIMGFFGNLWNKAKKTGNQIGTFLKEKVRPVIGKIAGGVKKVSHFVNNDEGVNSFLDTISSLHPGVGKAVEFGRKISQGAEAGADFVEKGLGFADRAGAAITSGNFGAAKGLAAEGRDLFNQGKAFKDQYATRQVKQN